MKIAFLSDIHANVPALEKAMELIRQSDAEAVVCLGDLVHYGPQPEETIRILMHSDIDCIQGNCDRAVARGRETTGETYDNPHWTNIAADFFEWTGNSISPGSRKWLKNLPEESRFVVGKTAILCVHGLPGRQSGQLPENAAMEVYDGILSRAAANVVVCGLTHTPSVIRRPRGIIINPGSVGGGTLPSGGTFMILTVPEQGTPEVETVEFKYSTDKLEEPYRKAGRGDLFFKCLKLGRDQRGNWHTDKPEWRQKWAEPSLKK